MNEMKQVEVFDSQMMESQKTGMTAKPGRVNGKNSEYRSGSGFIPKKLNNEIEVLLQMHKDQAAHKDKKVGE